MKKIQKLLLSISLVLLFANSCEEDRLDILPDIETPYENAIESEDDMQKFVVGIYKEFGQAQSFGANILIFGDLISDNLFISKGGSADVSFTTTGSFNWSEDISDFSQWDALYDAIAQANIVITNETLPESQNVRNYKGEALIARGLAHFYLLNFYSANPTSGLNPDYGIPLNLVPYEPNLSIPRSTISECYDQIISDLESGIEMMTNQIPLNKGYLSPTAAKLILSRVYLTRGEPGDYQLALDYANAVISSAGIGNAFNFVSKDDYYDYFTSTEVALSEDQPETVWEINFNGIAGQNIQINDNLSSYYSNTGSRRKFMFTKVFYDSFGDSDSDERRKLLHQSGASNLDDPKGYWTRKWFRYTTAEGNWGQNVKVLRMSEAKLNRIEALYHLGQTSTALAELNSFAISRGGTTYSGTNLLNDILTERRKEFFGEGYRFFDLKRNNLPIIKESNCYTDICEVPANDKIFVLPIPRSEMSINTNIKQYPDWPTNFPR